MSAPRQARGEREDRVFSARALIDHPGFADVEAARAAYELLVDRAMPSAAQQERMFAALDRFQERKRGPASVGKVAGHPEHSRKFAKVVGSLGLLLAVAAAGIVIGQASRRASHSGVHYFGGTDGK